jgi:hypothetical protein
MKKLVDTISAPGRAEKEIAFNVDFEKFLRSKYNLKEIKQIDLDGIVKKYQLKGITFGNYVTQEERYFYIFKTSQQLEALAKIKGSNNLGKGILTISIGAHGIGGKVNAHYSPLVQIINLARGRKGDFSDFMKGENSFVHEYGHFLDFYQGHIVDKALNYNFASENHYEQGAKKTLMFSDPVDVLIKDEDYYKSLRTPYLRSRVELFARLFEAGITHYVNDKHPEFKRFFDRSYSEGIYYKKEKILSKKLHVKMANILKAI